MGYARVLLAIDKVEMITVLMMMMMMMITDVFTCTSFCHTDSLNLTGIRNAALTNSLSGFRVIDLLEYFVNISKV